MIKELALKVAGEEFKGPAGLPSKLANPGNATLIVEDIIQVLMTGFFVIAGLVALAFIIYGGIRWIASGGEKQAVENARKTVTYSVIGLIVILSSFMIINMIGDFFGVKLLGIP